VTRTELDLPSYADPAKPPPLRWPGDEITYGETVIAKPYARERWSPQCELLEVDLLIGDLHRLVPTLRRRERF
jgi:hypothetical protein